MDDSGYRSIFMGISRDGRKDDSLQYILLWSNCASRCWCAFATLSRALLALVRYCCCFCSSSDRQSERQSTGSTQSDVQHGTTRHGSIVGPFAFNPTKLPRTNECDEMAMGEATALAALLCRPKQQDSFAVRLSCTTSSVADRRVWSMV